MSRSTPSHLRPFGLLSDSARSASSPVANLTPDGRRMDAVCGLRLGTELCPFPFGDDRDGAVDDLDCCLFVDGVGGAADVGGRLLCVGQGVGWEQVQVREARTPSVRVL